MLSVKSAGKKTTQLPAGDGWGICIGLVWFGLLTRMLLSSISFVSISGCCRGYPAAGQGDPYSVVLSVSSLHSCSHRSLVSSLSLYPPHIRLAQSVPPGFSHSLTGGGVAPPPSKETLLLPRRSEWCVFVQGDGFSSWTWILLTWNHSLWEKRWRLSSSNPSEVFLLALHHLWWNVNLSQMLSSLQRQLFVNQILSRQSPSAFRFLDGTSCPQ